MLDIQYIRENADRVKQNAAEKNINVDIDNLLQKDQTRRSLLQQVDAQRQERNELAESAKGQRPTDEQIEKGKTLKEASLHLEEELDAVEKEYLELLKQVPNMRSEDTPVGHSEDDNRVIKQWGEKPTFEFEPKPHWDMLDLIDETRAAAISGSRFAFLKNGLVRLQFALNLFAMDIVTSEQILQEIIQNNSLNVTPKPFAMLAPPMMMRGAPYAMTERLKPDDVTFKLANDDLYLIGSAEHPMSAYFLGETLNEADLPIRFVGHSTSFRREVGSAGKDTRGILRTHHFDKLELESFSTPEQSWDEHEFMIAIQEYIMQKLNLPYQVVLKCTFDMGAPNARGVDIETWMPGQNTYRETHSADLLTDFQARSLRTKVERQNGDKEIAHTNDATAVTTRVSIAILENYQTAEGNVKVPDVLRPYMQNKEVL